MSFDAQWDQFIAARLWELLPPELCVRMQWSSTPHLVSALGVMAQPGGVFGCTFYFDVRAFDAMWNGEPFLIEGITAIGTANDSSAQCVRVHHSEPTTASDFDRELLGAAVGLLFRQLSGNSALTVLSDGSMLSLAQVR